MSFVTWNCSFCQPFIHIIQCTITSAIGNIPLIDLIGCFCIAYCTLYATVFKRILKSVWFLRLIFTNQYNLIDKHIEDGVCWFKIIIDSSFTILPTFLRFNTLWPNEKKTSIWCGVFEFRLLRNKINKRDKTKLINWIKRFCTNEIEWQVSDSSRMWINDSVWRRTFCSYDQANTSDESTDATSAPAPLCVCVAVCPMRADSFRIGPTTFVVKS